LKLLFSGFDFMGRLKLIVEFFMEIEIGGDNFSRLNVVLGIPIFYKLIE